MSLARKTYRGGRPTPITRLEKLQALLRAEVLAALRSERMDTYRLLERADELLDKVLTEEYAR